MPFKHGTKVGSVLIAGLALPGVAQADAPGHHVQPGPAMSEGAGASAQANASAQAHGSSSGAVKASRHGDANAHVVGQANGHVVGHANAHAIGHANAHAIGQAGGHANGHANERVRGEANGSGRLRGSGGAAGGSAVEATSPSHSCSYGGTGRGSTWRFEVISGQFAPGAASNPIIRAFPRGNSSGKAMLEHATGSLSTPFVPITTSVNGLNGHGEDTVLGTSSPQAGVTGTAPGAPTTVPSGTPGVAGNGGTNESGTQSPAGESAPSGSTGSQGSSPTGASGVLGASGSGGGSAGTGGNTAPASALASRAATSSATAKLPYTGSNLVIVLLAAAGCLGTGLAFRRVVGGRS